MSKRERFDVAKAVNFARHADPREICVELQHKSVAKGTLKVYRSRMGVLHRFAASLNKELSKEIFLLFIGALEDQKKGGTSTADGYRCAALHFFRVEGVRNCSWADDEDIIKAVSGFEYNAKEGKGEGVGNGRGAITQSMMYALVNWAPVEFRLAIPLHFFAALRIGQLVALRADDLEGSTLWLSKDKRADAQNKFGEVHAKPVSGEAVAAFEAAARGKIAGELLFPPTIWKMRKYREMIHEASLSLKWPDRLDFVPHSFRHGGTDVIVKAVVKASLAEHTQMSSSTQKRYARSNERR